MIVRISGCLAGLAAVIDYMIYPHSILLSENTGVVSVCSLVIWATLFIGLMTTTARNRKIDQISYHYNSTNNRSTESSGLARLHEHRCILTTKPISKMLPFVLGILFIIIVYHGTIGSKPLTYGDWGYLSQSTLRSRLFPFPPLWNPQNLGTNNILGSPQNVLIQISSVLAKLNIPYALTERVIYFYPSIIGLFLFTYLLGRKLGLSRVGASIAAVFVSSNTYQISIIAGGWLTVALAEAVLPLLLLLSTMIETANPIGMATAVAVSISVALWTAPQFAYLDIITFIIFTIIFYKPKLMIRNRRHWLTFGLVATAMVTILQAQWLIPIIAGDAATLPGGYQSKSALATFSFQNLTDALAIFQPAWPTLKAFSEHAVPVIMIIIPIIILFALDKSNPLDRALFPLGLIYLSTSVLATGTLSPFAKVNLIVFSYLPGGSLFRNPVLYLGIAQLAAGLLLGSVFSNTNSKAKIGRTSTKKSDICSLAQCEE